MKVLFIFPHPDDETVFAGGMATRHVRRGNDVVWICASYGERGGTTEKRSSKIFYWMFALAGKFPILLFFLKLIVYWLGIFRKQNIELARTRKWEAKKVAKIIGIRKITFWEIPDMRFQWNKKELMQKLEKCMKELKLDVVYAFHPNGITGHPDHMALSRCVAEVVKNLEGKKPRLFYATFSKELAEKYRLPLLGISDESIDEKNTLSLEEINLKREAMATYESQKYLWKIFLERYPELLEREYFIRPK